MKKLLTLILIAAVILLLPPYFIGSKVESEFNNQLAMASANQAYNLTLKDYQKGWFHSVAIVDFTIVITDTDLAEEESVTFTLTQEMQHGPFLWTADSFAIGLMDATANFQLSNSAPNYQNEASDWSDDTLVLTSRTDFDLSSKIDLTLKSFTLSNSTSIIEIMPAKGQLSYNMQGRMQGRVEWQGINAEENGEQQVKLETVSIDLDQQLVSGELFAADAMFDGTFNAKISRLILAENNPMERVLVQNLSIAGNSDVQDDVTSVKASFKIESIEALAQKFTHFDYDFTLENLDTQTLIALNETMSATQKNSNQDPMAISAKIQGLLPQLMERGPLLKINKLAVTTSEGNIDSNLQMSIDQSIYDANNPMTMMIALDAKADGYAPEAFFASIGLAPTIEQLVQQNMLVRDEKNVKFNLTFKNGQALVNGGPISLGAF